MIFCLNLFWLFLLFYAECSIDKGDKAIFRRCPQTRTDRPRRL